MNRRLALAAFGGVVLFGSLAGAFFLASAGGPAMTQSATRFLATLTDDQRKTALLDYDTPKRVDWHFIPKDQRKGLQIRDMSEPQRQAARALLQAALSEIGHEKATKIMSYERLLKALEQGRKGGPLRDPERYYFTIFGQPQSSGRWGLSIEGHHLSLNFVVEKDRVISSTPTVFAANPATVQNEVEGGQPKGARLLAKEEERAFQLLQSLTSDQRKTAVIDATAPKEVRAAGEAQPPNTPAVGIAASQLSDEQKKVLHSLIEAYTENVPEEVAHDRWSAIRESGFDKVHFAWAGADKPGVGHYYRLQGPTFLVEFVNTQPDSAGNPANHIHSLWRDMRGDFALPIQ